MPYDYGYLSNVPSAVGALHGTGDAISRATMGIYRIRYMQQLQAQRQALALQNLAIRRQAMLNQQEHYRYLNREAQARLGLIPEQIKAEQALALERAATTDKTLYGTQLAEQAGTAAGMMQRGRAEALPHGIEGPPTEATASYGANLERLTAAQNAALVLHGAGLGPYMQGKEVPVNATLFSSNEPGQVVSYGLEHLPAGTTSRNLGTGEVYTAPGSTRVAGTPYAVQLSNALSRMEASGTLTPPTAAIPFERMPPDSQLQWSRYVALQQELSQEMAKTGVKMPTGYTVPQGAAVAPQPRGDFLGLGKLAGNAVNILQGIGRAYGYIHPQTDQLIGGMTNALGGQPVPRPPQLQMFPPQPQPMTNFGQQITAPSVVPGTTPVTNWIYDPATGGMIPK